MEKIAFDFEILTARAVTYYYTIKDTDVTTGKNVFWAFYMYSAKTY